MRDPGALAQDIRAKLEAENAYTLGIMADTEELQQKLFAEMKGPVKDVLKQYGLTERFTPDRFFSTVGAAVDELTGTVRGDLEGTKWDDTPEEPPQK